MRPLAIVHGGGEQCGGWCPAREQYDSAYFDRKAEYAETLCDDWMLVSEAHDLFAPETWIAIDDTSLDDLTAVERSNWSCRVRPALERTATARRGRPDAASRGPRRGPAGVAPTADRRGDRGGTGWDRTRTVRTGR